MRVGVIARSVEPSCGGGFTLEAEILAALGEGRGHLHHEYVVCASSPEPDARLSGSGLGTVVFDVEDSGPTRSPFHRRVLRRLGQTPAVGAAPPVAASRDGQPDCLLNLTQWVVPRLNLPCVQMLWDLQHRYQPMFPEVRANGQWQARETLFARNLRTASVIVTGTRAGTEQAARFYSVPPERMRIVPLPTPADALARGATRRSAFGSEPPFVFYPAQFWPHKNHVTALLALQILRDRHGITLGAVFTGRDYGSRRNVEEASRALGLTSQVRIEDFVSREEVLSLYERATALVFPTFFGPDNLPPLEAFALRCPVVASRVEGADEQLGTAAVLFNPGDEIALADGLRRVLCEPPLRERLLAEGHARAHAWKATDWVRSVDAVFEGLSKAVRCWRFDVGRRG